MISVIVEYSSFPTDADIENLLSIGATNISRSKFLNIVYADVDEGNIERIRNLPNVKETHPDHQVRAI